MDNATFSIKALVIPIALIGYAALSVLRQITFLTLLAILEILLTLNQFKMKKIIFLSSFLLSFSLIAQGSVRMYNLNVKRGYESSVVETFSDFAGGQKWKSGGVMLQAVGFKAE